MSHFTQKLAPLTGADCFVRALNCLMRNNGQNELIGQTHLILDRLPDLPKLQEAARTIGRSYPLIYAQVSRSFFTFKVGWYGKKMPPPELCVGLWKEKGIRLPAADESPYQEIETQEKWLTDMLNEPLTSRHGRKQNLHIDLLLKKDGSSLLVITWSHLLFDGKGAELLLAALVDASKGTFTPPTAPLLPPPTKPISFMERIQKARPVVEHFFQLAKNPYLSLCGPRPRPGRLRYRLLQMNQEETTTIQERAALLAGPLFNLGFYLACAARAHRQAFLARGEDPPHYVISVPVQVRRKGGESDPFQNCVTILFFSLEKHDLTTMESAVAAIQKQFQTMTRSRLDRSFGQILDILYYFPSFLYMKFVKGQFGGEFTSFFHSFTGNFTVEPENFCDAKVLNAYHIPSVSAPPGSGLFFGVFHNQLTATCAWREGSVLDSEVERMMVQLREDLLGTPSDKKDITIEIASTTA